MQYAEIPGFAYVDWGSAQKSADQFVSSNWTQLITIIRGYNDHAKLIVTTGYSPYNLEAVTGYESDVQISADGYNYSEMTNKLVSQMNTVINSSLALNYSVADVYDYFTKNYQPRSMSQVTLFYPYFFGIPVPTLRDPHPSQLGQQKIFELVRDKFLTAQ